MTISEFKNYWENKMDTAGTVKRTVGIGVNWSAIKEGLVLQFFGETAWEMMGIFYAPHWGNFERTKLKEWLNPSRPDYGLFLKEEEKKIDFYRKNGLPEDFYREFCAFADITGKIGSLGDGNHRYIDCNYLRIVEKVDISAQIEKCRLDVLCVDNLHEVLSMQDLPLDYIAK